MTKINNVTLAQFSKEQSLRNDCVYQRLATTRYASNSAYYKFSDLFSVVEEKVRLDELVGEFKYCQIGDVTKDGKLQPVSLDLDNRDLLDGDYYRKIEKGDIMRAERNDIFMSFLLPQDSNIVGKLARIGDDDSGVYFSTAFLRLQSKQHAEMMYYCLRSLFYKDLVATARIRKGYTGYATLSKDDLLDLRFDKSAIDTLFSRAKRITPDILAKEQKISSVIGSVLSTQEIIDSVFRREFSFDYDTFERLKAQKAYKAKPAMFANNPDLRFSAEFHRPAGDFAMQELTGITDKRIRHFLAEPIVLGASISPSDFDENGTAYYVSMATIKSLEVELDDSQLVSRAYYEAKKSKALQEGDIVVARSGVAIGKTALVKEDFDGVFADFTMRIRLDKTKCTPLFAYYYFRTKYFQYLIECYKKGLQNQNIFPIVMREFPIPDISLVDQKRVVNEIQAEVSKQDDVKKQIAELRSQIVDIITRALKCAG